LRAARQPLSFEADCTTGASGSNAETARTSPVGRMVCCVVRSCVSSSFGPVGAEFKRFPLLGIGTGCKSIDGSRFSWSLGCNVSSGWKVRGCVRVSGIVRLSGTCTGAGLMIRPPWLGAAGETEGTETPGDGLTTVPPAHELQVELEGTVVTLPYEPLEPHEPHEL
jgi:hypothetical protein